MSSTAELQLLYRIGNAPLHGYPFAHLYVRDVFPPDYYAQLRRHLPRPEAMRSLEEARGVRGYPERSVMGIDGQRPAGMSEGQFAFWSDLWSWMLGGRLGRLLLQKFAPVIEPRLAAMPDVEIFDEALLVHDRTQYALGPHTDSPRKVLSALFYLPEDERLASHGTSIYQPKDPEFRCPGGPHHPFERFERMATMPFVPNALFAFAKTDHSFHGVEPFTAPSASRWLLLFDLYLRRTAAGSADSGSADAPRVVFRF